MANATNATNPPALTPADLNTSLNHEPRIQDLRLAEALGFSRPRDIRKIIERHRDALERLGGICDTVAQNTGPGHPSREFWLTKLQALYIATQAGTTQATEITIQVVQVFDAVTSGRMPAPALLSDDKRHLLEALDALIEAEVRHRLGGRVTRSMAAMMKVLCDEGDGDA